MVFIFAALALLSKPSVSMMSFSDNLTLILGGVAAKPTPSAIELISLRCYYL